LRRAGVWIVLAVCLLAPAFARATPFFARTYNVKCVNCHAGVPRLNSFGLAFKLNGFRLPGMEKKAPLAWQKTVPLAVQIEPTSERFSPGAHKADFTDTQLLAGGLLTRTTSFYIHHSLWIDDKPVEFPSYEVWVQQVLSERGKVMLKVGQFELPYAYSPGTHRVTVSVPLIFGAALQGNDVRLGSAMRGIQLTGLFPRVARAYVAVGAPSVLTPGNTVGEREFFGEFRDVFLRVASPNPSHSIGGFIYLTRPTRNPADPSTHNDAQRFGLEGTLIVKEFQIDAAAVYGENSDPAGNGRKGILRGGFVEVDKMVAPWVGLTGRFDIQSTVAATRANSDALTLAVRFYPVPGQRYLRLQAEYQAADHGRSSTALLAGVAF
jgi:hypothetical protein